MQVITETVSFSQSFDDFMKIDLQPLDEFLSNLPDVKPIYEELTEDDFLKISKLVNEDLEFECEELRNIIDSDNTFKSKREEIDYNPLTWNKDFYRNLLRNMNRVNCKENINQKVMFSYSKKLINSIRQFWKVLNEANTKHQFINHNDDARNMHYSVWNMIFENEEIIRSMIHLGVPRNFFYDN